MIREALTPRMLDALEPEEAAARFIARRSEGLTESEQQLLGDWLAAHETHRLAFDSAERGWRSLDEGEGNEILEAMRIHALASHRAAPTWRPLALGAAALAACVALLFLVPGWNPSTPQDPGIQYASARGEVREVELPDGSTMTLDADSRAIGHFSERARSLTLERGRAYFTVRADRSRPFTVTAAGKDVVVTGTRFDVNMAAGGLTVTLLEGHVHIGPEDASAPPVAMVPGQQYVERQGGASIRSIGDAGEHAIAWREGFIRFNDQRLDEAAAVMNRYTQDQITISDPAIAALRVSGQFRAGETQRFADTLAEMHNLRSVRRASEIDLVSR